VGWREWLGAELTIFRSTLRGLRRGWFTSGAARRMRALVWAVSPHDGHRHAFVLSHLTGLARNGYTQARCSHPASRASLRAAIRQTGPLCVVCSVLVGDALVDARHLPTSLPTP
jgi:hypothetical protein